MRCMSDFFNAFEMSPVPSPGPDAVACRGLVAESVTGPRDTPWNTRDVEVITPERARVVFTAAKRLDPDSREARDLESVGIVAPESTGGGDNNVHG
jgi:hypothetical protein